MRASGCSLLLLRRGANEPMMCSLGKTKGYSPPSSSPPSCCNLLDYVRLCFRQGLRTDGRGRRTADGQSDLRAAFVRVGPFKGNPISGAPLLSLSLSSSLSLLFSLSLFRSDVYQTTPTHSGIISPLTISDGCTARTREALRLSLSLSLWPE